MLRTKKWQKTNKLKTGFALFCPIILQRQKVVMILMKAAGQRSSPPSCETIMHTNAVPSNLHCLLFTRHCHNGPAAVHSSNENHHFTSSPKKKSICFVPVVKNKQRAASAGGILKLTAAALTVNTVVCERYLRRHPAKWSWGFRRWGRKQEALERVYPLTADDSKSWKLVKCPQLIKVSPAT